MKKSPRLLQAFVEAAASPILLSIMLTTESIDSELEYDTLGLYVLCAPGITHLACVYSEGDVVIVYNCITQNPLVCIARTVYKYCSS